MLDVITWECGTVKSLNNDFTLGLRKPRKKPKRKPGVKQPTRRELMLAALSDDKNRPNQL